MPPAPASPDNRGNTPFPSTLSQEHRLLSHPILPPCWQRVCYLSFMPHNEETEAPKDLVACGSSKAGTLLRLHSAQHVCPAHSVSGIPPSCPALAPTSPSGLHGCTDSIPGKACFYEDCTTSSHFHTGHHHPGHCKPEKMNSLIYREDLE